MKIESIMLIVIDFQDTKFNDPKNCAICKALKRLFGFDWVFERVDDVVTPKFWYRHTPYGLAEFNEDMALCLFSSFDDTPIREIVFSEPMEHEFICEP